MRLSEAIRLGAMWSPQTRGAFFHRRGQEVATCALGAAFVASGIEGSAWVRDWPILHAVVRPAELPADLKDRPYPLRVIDVIIGLNDSAGWTRTMISEWVERFEDRHPESSGDGAQVDQHTRAEFKLPGDLDEDEDDFAALCVR